jgi:hypothetical protein
MVTRRDITVERVKPSGAWKVSAMVNGYHVWRLFLGYTKREAIRDYLAEVDQW